MTTAEQLPCYLMRLPVELRREIFTQAMLLSITPKSQTTTTTPKLALLQKSRRVYAEARILPFQIQPLTFTPVFDSNVATCLALLRKLTPQQRRMIRRLELPLDPSDLSGHGMVREVVRLLNEETDHEERADRGEDEEYIQGLRELRLDLSREVTPTWYHEFYGQGCLEHFLDPERSTWLCEGVLKISSLLRLEINVEQRWTRHGAGSENEEWSKLEEDLRKRMPWIDGHKLSVRVLKTKRWANETGIPEAEWEYVPEGKWKGHAGVRFGELQGRVDSK